MVARDQTPLPLRNLRTQRWQARCRASLLASRRRVRPAKPSGTHGSPHIGGANVSPTQCRTPTPLDLSDDMPNGCRGDKVGNGACDERRYDEPHLSPSDFFAKRRFDRCVHEIEPSTKAVLEKAL